MSRLLITGAASPLMTACAETIAAQENTELIVLADAHHPAPLPSAVTITVGESYVEIRDAIHDHRIDTIVHGALSSDRLGQANPRREAEVIATMHVAAAAADLDGPVRSLVALSSTARYPASPGSPQFHDERLDAGVPASGSYAASLAEAEDYLLALAEQRPNLAVCVLRTADLIGPSVTSPLASMLEATMTPMYFGFDPMVQFLHVDDAVRAVEHAVARDLAGVFNVASRGVILWSRAIHLSGGLPLMLLPPVMDPLAPIRSFIGARGVAAGMSAPLRYGRVASTDRLEATAYTAVHRVEDCVRELRATRSGSCARRWRA